MATKNKRCTVMITEDIEKNIEQLKKSKYYDKSYSELYRNLLIAGIEKLNKSS